MFTKYREALEKMPRAWGEINSAVVNVKKDNEQIKNFLIQQASLIHQVNKEAEKIERTIANTSGHMTSLVRGTRDFVRHIREGTDSLLKWTGIVGAVSGLVGAGGLFGIERLAQSASGMRRSAQGLGATSAEVGAFGLNFGRILDPRSFLGSVQQAQNDVTKRVGLYGAGLTDRDIIGKSPIETALALLPRIKQLVDRAPEGQLAQVLQSQMPGFDIDLQTAQRLKRTSSGELQGFINQTRRDQTALFLTDETQKKWQDFLVQLDRASHTIQTGFIEGLVKIAPELTKLSDTFTTAIKDFLQSGVFKDWVLAATEGLKDLDSWIKSPEFKDDVKAFTDGIGKLSKSIINALKLLGIVPDSGPKKDPTMGDTATGALVGGGLGAFLGARFGPWGALVGGALGGILGGAKVESRMPHARPPGGGTYDPNSGQYFPDSTFKQGAGSGVPNVAGMTEDERNFLGLVRQYESMGGQNVMNYVGKGQGLDPTTPKGYTAQGYYQLLNTNWRRLAPALGITVPNAMAASDYDQTRVALALDRESGHGNWTNTNPALAAAVRRGDRARGGASGSGPLSEYYRQHGGFLNDPGWHAGKGASLGNWFHLAAFDGSIEEGSLITPSGRHLRRYGRAMIPGTNILDRGRSEQDLFREDLPFQEWGRGMKEPPSWVDVIPKVPGSLDRKMPNPLGHGETLPHNFGHNSGVKIEIHNQTGGSAVVTGSQVAL